MTFHTKEVTQLHESGAMIDDPVLLNDWHVVARSLDAGTGKVLAARFLGHEAAPKFGEELAIYGMIALSQGTLLVSMVWAAAIACMLDRRFLHAAGWLLAGALLSSFGIIHASDLNSAGIVNKLGIFAAPEFAISYTAAALFLAGCHFYNRRRPSPAQDSEAI